MKPRWERTVNSITAENFYAWTGCRDGFLIRYLLIRYVKDLFDDHYMLKKGFTFARLCSSCDIQAVCDGSIVDVEFHLQPVGAGMHKIWTLSFSSNDAIAVERSFKMLLEYLEKGIAAFVEINDETMKLLEAKVLKKIYAFRNKCEYVEYIKTQS